MFESAELGHVTSKEAYEELVPGLRMELLDAQFDMQQLKAFAAVVLVEQRRRRGQGRDREPAQRMDGSAAYRFSRFRCSDRRRA